MKEKKYNLRWWITKLPTIIKYLLKDLDNLIQTYMSKYLWVTLIIWGLIYAAGMKFTGQSAQAWIFVSFAASIIAQGALMIGLAVIQFVAIFWFMARTKTDIIVPGDKKSVTFADYKGQPNLVKMMKHWLSLMQNKEERIKFQSMGGKFPTGILLYGLPGTGKTLLAKCMAGEGQIAFMSMEASGFRAMFFGVDVLKMISFCNKARQLARQYGACVAYLDEIDAIGTSRGGVMGGQQQTGMNSGGVFGGTGGALTRLLYEMDGMDDNFSRQEKFLNQWRLRLGLPIPPRSWHVLYMGSTNRPDTLDSALVREGRFDRKIEVPLPDAASRRLVIDYYLSKVAHDESVNVEVLVMDTSWATPAKLCSAIVKDAVRLAIADGRDKVSHLDIELALQEQAMGLETPIEEMPLDQRRQIAYHEAGHAVAMHYVLPEMRIVHASLVRRGSALAHVLPTQKEEMYAIPLEVAKRSIVMDLAGQVATMILTGKRWTGTGGDYTNANGRLNQLLLAGEFGPPIGNLEALHRMYEKKIQIFWEDAEEKTTNLLQKHWAAVEIVAETLLEKTTVSGDELVRLMESVDGGKT